MIEKNKILREGLRSGDLEGVVLPLVSIDEFKSRIDDSTCVIGFYVHDKIAAKDLNKFIQGSPVSIIDTDISPAPDQSGYFLVFVELTCNSTFAKNVEYIVNEISHLTSINMWKMHIRTDKKSIDFDVKRLEQFTNEFQKSLKLQRIKKFKDGLQKTTNADGFSVNENILTFVTKGKKINFIIETITTLQPLDNVFKNGNIVANLRETLNEISLKNLLGSEWNVTSFGDKFLAFNIQDNMSLFIKSAY